MLIWLGFEIKLYNIIIEAHGLYYRIENIIIELLSFYGE